ncbi:MAG: MoaD/ThiS family protein [Bacteroidota bacterium]
MAKIIVPTPLRKFTQNQTSVETGGNTIKEAIGSLVTQFPDLRQHLLTKEGSLRTFVRVYLGEEDIKQLEGEATPIQSQSEISIIPAIAGGKA